MDKKIQTNNKIEALDLFRDMIPFERLEENINVVFFEYLKGKDPNTFPENFNEICSDIHALLQFLKTMRELEK